MDRAVQLRLINVIQRPDYQRIKMRLVMNVSWWLFKAGMRSCLSELKSWNDGWNSAATRSLMKILIGSATSGVHVNGRSREDGLIELLYGREHQILLWRLWFHFPRDAAKKWGQWTEIKRRDHFSFHVAVIFQNSEFKSRVYYQRGNRTYSSRSNTQLNNIIIQPKIDTLIWQFKCFLP